MDKLEVNSMRATPEARPAAAVWFVVAGVIFSIATIIQSLRQGQLAAPATYDDVIYLVDAGRRLLGFYDLGFPALFHGYLVDPPHAPTSTLTSFAGFLLFGIHDWSQALINAVWVVALLLVIRRWLADLPRWATAAVVVAVLAWPVLGFLVIEGRPDIVNGFLLAFGCIMLVEQPWVTASRGRMVCIALIFAATLLTKPSVFPITLVLYGLSLLLATAVDYLEHGRAFPRRTALLRNASALALTVLIVLPHYVLAVGREITYIITTTFTTEKDLWAVKLPLYDQATFYLWGDAGGKQTMGVWFFVTAALIILVLAGLVLTSRRPALRRAAAMAIIFAASFGLVSIPAHKSAYLGVQVTAFCLVFFLLATRCLFRFALERGTVGRGAAALFAVVLVGGAVASFQWHWFHRTGRPSVASAQDLAKRHELIDQTYAAVAPQTGEVSKVYFPAASYYLNADILNFAFVRRGDAVDGAFDDHRTADRATHLAHIKTATHVVLFSPDDPDVLNWLPSAGSLPAVSAAVKADPTFVRVAALDPPISGGKIEVYARKSALPTLSPGKGVLALEGPYPQWNLPRLHWVTGPIASLRILDPTPGKATLRLKLQSPVANQTIVASTGGSDQGSCSVPVAYQTETCTIDLIIAPGDSEVLLRFGLTDPTVSNHRAIMLLGQSLER